MALNHNPWCECAACKAERESDLAKLRAALAERDAVIAELARACSSLMENGQSPEYPPPFVAAWKKAFSDGEAAIASAAKLASAS